MANFWRFLAFFTIIILVSLFLDFLVDKSRRNEVDEVRIMDFSVRQRGFGGDFFRALVYAGQGNHEKAVFYMDKIKDGWQKMETDFGDRRPRDFRRINDWASSLDDINEDIRDAKKRQEEGRMSEAYNSLKSALSRLEKLLSEAELQNIDIELAAFYVPMKDLLQNEKREEVVAYLPELKMRLTKMRELKQGDEEFQDYLAKIGDAISIIEASTPRVYNEYKEGLAPAFLEILE